MQKVAEMFLCRATGRVEEEKEDNGEDEKNETKGGRNTRREGVKGKEEKMPDCESFIKRVFILKLNSSVY